MIPDVSKIVSKIAAYFHSTLLNRGFPDSLNREQQENEKRRKVQ